MASDTDISGEMPVVAESWDDRTVRLIGVGAAEQLRRSKVLVVGLGGVGGYASEMLVRSGVGHLVLVDADEVSVTNINRQLIATVRDVGESKAFLFASRFHEINPSAVVDARRMFVTPGNVSALLDEGFDYVVDAIDTVAPKVALLSEALRRRIPVISSMGAGGRIDPTRIMYADLWETREDGLARAVRQHFKRMGLRKPLRVVCSDESPRSHSLIHVEEENKRSSYGTLATIPSVFGIYLANHVILKLSRIK